MTRRIRDITNAVAAAVINEAIEEDLAEGYREMNSRDLKRLNKVFLNLVEFLKYPLIRGGKLHGSG